MDISDGMDKPWDHAWTTEEMRKKRREWSLAGDVGLLKHLQQFSDNLLSKANKTEEALESLTTQLNETAIFLDNVTNTSLALANTQFIESRIKEDRIEIEQKRDISVEDPKDQDSSTADLIASVSESVKQGLNIMYENYKEMEFEDSDSEEEDGDNKVVLSIVLGPNNRYQDRPLPYVIGSEKWKNSSKIGLGSSSSSDSEQVEEEEELESEDDDRNAFKNYNIDALSKPNAVTILSTPSEPNYNKRNDVSYMANDKIDTISHSNVDSIPEPITPSDNVSKISLPTNITPNFAEELAKRLNTVRQVPKPAVVDEKDEASINSLQDDLFTAEKDENASDDKNIFSENKGFLSDQSSESLWKEKPIKSYKNNIIPASIDVPPPISTISTNPKSAIDDLFVDADSDDSDDIFSSKNVVKTISKNKHSSNSNQSGNVENASKKYLDIAASAISNNMATSTPETNTNATNIFNDDEDVVDLFGTSKNQPPIKKKPIGGVPILGSILASDVESKLSNRLSRNQATESSDSNTPANSETSTRSNSIHDHSRNVILNDNVADQGSLLAARNTAENSVTANESSYSSGISIHPSSINNTGGSSLGVDFQPQMTSTRLKSEEIYRERIASDSLFAARTRNPVNATSNSNQLAEGSIEDISSIQQDDVFENDDLFGPPPLPKTDSKQAKSKVSSLFDDSDSGDELFSKASSGSRSQKSNDFFTTSSQHSEKTKFMQRRGLFDEEIDIFSNKDSPDVDIFGIAPKPTPEEENNVSSKKVLDVPDDDLFTGIPKTTASKSPGSIKSQNMEPPKKISLFDDEDVDDGDLFAAKPINKIDSKSESRIFSDDDNNDLFSVNKPVAKEQGIDKELSRSIADMEPRKLSVEKNERKGSDILSSNGMFSTAIGAHGLTFDDEDYDDLFETKRSSMETTKGEERSNTETIADVKIEQTPAKDSKTSNDPISQKIKEPDVSADTSDSIGQDNQKQEKLVISEKPIRKENVDSEMKKSPPKSLDILASSPPSEENAQGAKRMVSGKIKNLMGKMGDLKILSPMDVPPSWRKSEEKTDEEDSAADRDSNDGGCISVQGHSSPPTISEDSTTQKQSQQSTVSSGSHVESAISFDEPAQIETLSTTASKNRVRIQTKRRPQSRHARKSAIKQNGIDFDTVDNAEGAFQEQSQINQSSSVSGKEAAANINVNTEHTAMNTDRLISSSNENVHQITETNNLLTADDKSEIGSISKESSMSANKNTLLSPSTDEEDLFDVPPDLPEDPQKDDTLFGRAPILSPVERALSEKPPVMFKPLKDTHIKQIDDTNVNIGKAAQKMENNNLSSESVSNIEATISHTTKTESKQESLKPINELQEVVDPLRDSSHDPLKDPSQLFAFVTKTPSPEKGKNLLFAEDDSLFSSSQKKILDEQSTKKPTLDLFGDDVDGDLFSSSLVKPVKKQLKDTKISLFDEDDEDDALFGSVTKKSVTKVEPEKKSTSQQPLKNISLFDDDDNDTSLFSESSEPAQKSESGSIQERSSKTETIAGVIEPVKMSHVSDIFADQSTGEEDIFGSKPIKKKIVATSKPLFPSDDDDYDDNIFGKKSTNKPQPKRTETRPAVKKAVTRDLKKTAEKIAEDPLSVLIDD